MPEETQDHEEPKKSAKKNSIKLVMIIVGAALVLGGGGILSFMLLKNGSNAETSHEEKAETKDKKNAEDVKKGEALIPFEPFVVNLSAPGRYLKVTINFELNSQESKEFVSKRAPIIRDVVITLLSSKSAEAVSGPEGKTQLKDEILYKSNQALGENVITNLYFTEFVMQ